MIGPTPYTPAAVRRIRAGASASELGWSDTMYDRVCREHGIEGVPRQSAPPDARLVQHPASIRFKTETSEVTFKGKSIKLAQGVQAKVFFVLLNAYNDSSDRFISGSELYQAINSMSDPSTINGACRRMDGRLRLLGLSIETKMRHNGGYRLRVDAP